MKKILGFCVLGLMLCTSIVFCAEPVKEEAGPPSIVMQYIDGKKVNFSAIKFPEIVLVFATWCPHCRKSLEEYNETYDPKLKDFPIVAVDVGESPMLVDRFIRTKQLKFPVLLDQAGELPAHYGIHGIPTVLIFDKNGQKVYQGYTLPENWRTLIGT